MCLIFFLLSYLACSQKPWLNLPIDDRHFGYITKLTTKQNKTKHGHPVHHVPTQVHHKGWMESGQETVFCWVPVHELTMVGSLGSFF
jgi:hypothetical protein